MKCQKGIYERLKSARWMLDKIFDKLENNKEDIKKAVGEGNRSLENLYRKERILLIKQKDSLNEYIKYLETVCYIGVGEEKDEKSESMVV